MRPPSTVARAMARSIGWLSRFAGRGGGTTLPGVVLLKLRPDAVAELAAPLERSIVISATNGKTTTARLVVAALEAVDTPIVANTAGSNLLRGVATALLDADRPTGATGVFEVDEAALGSVVDQLGPDVVVLMNLFRDQLDRYGELEALADRWVELVDRLPDTDHPRAQRRRPCDRRTGPPPRQGGHLRRRRPRRPPGLWSSTRPTRPRVGTVRARWSMNGSSSVISDTGDVPTATVGARHPT